jgi:hypothetical protein
LASSTPGTDVVAMAMLPDLATTVPAAGSLFAAGDAPGSALVLCGVPLAVLPALAPLVPGLGEPLAEGALVAPDPLVAAAPPEGAMD